jgi:hypothetical protein
MAPTPNSAGHRPAANPIPGATWQGRVLEAGAITKELSRLWGQVTMAGAAGGDGREASGAARTNGSGPAGAGRTAEASLAAAAAAEGRPVGVLTRASTLNLTAVAHSRTDAQRVERTVERLGDVYPSRATILVADPAVEHHDEPGLDVRVALLEQEAGKGRPALRYESVVVEVNAGDERQLASIASPLLVADLPDFLWWADATIVGGGLFDDLIAVADRLIVDTSRATDPATELSHLAGMLGEGPCPKLSDFAWQRLNPWRSLVAQFFDPPAMRPLLNAIDEARITYGAAGRDGQTGFTGALLLAGWLGARLGWQAPGEMVREHAGAGTGTNVGAGADVGVSWRATLRAGGRRERRELALVLEPAMDPMAECGLATVSLRAAGGASFRIERFDPEELATISYVPGSATSRRMVYAALPDEAALLADELRHFGRDGVYEEALAFAATLAPDVAQPAPT